MKKTKEAIDSQGKAKEIVGREEYAFPWVTWWIIYAHIGQHFQAFTSIIS